MALQVALEAVEALRQPLGVVEAVHPDRQHPPLQAGMQLAQRRLGHRGGRLLLDVRGVDADRECAGPEAASTGRLQHVLVDDAAAAVQAHVGLEAVLVAAGLEADQVVCVQGRHQALVVGHGHQQVGRGHRHVQEEPDPAVDPAFAQQRCQRDQVVVVDPDDVVRAQPRRQLVGEQRVDPAVALAGGAVVVDQVQAEVQQRPQRAVGEPVVVRVQVRAVEVHGDVADVAVDLFVHLAAGLAHALAAPAEPQPAAFAQRPLQRHRQAAGAVLAGDRHPVGHHHQPAHEASCQERDRRMAAMIRPTCE